MREGMNFHVRGHVHAHQCKYSCVHMGLSSWQAGQQAGRQVKCVLRQVEVCLHEVVPYVCAGSDLAPVLTGSHM